MFNKKEHKKQYKHGYPISFNPTHPRAINTGYVYDHVLVIEKLIGRTPKSNEPIHHLDLNRKNCEPSNLYLCKSTSEHILLHSSLDIMARQLFELGFIVFDREKREYCLGERILDTVK